MRLVNVSPIACLSLVIDNETLCYTTTFDVSLKIESKAIDNLQKERTQIYGQMHDWFQNQAGKIWYDLWPLLRLPDQYIITHLAVSQAEMKTPMFCLILSNFKPIGKWVKVQNDFVNIWIFISTMLSDVKQTFDENKYEKLFLNFMKFNIFQTLHVTCLWRKQNYKKYLILINELHDVPITNLTKQMCWNYRKHQYFHLLLSSQGTVVDEILRQWELWIN